MAFGTQLVLGVLLVYLSAVHPPETAALQGFLFILGLLALLLGWRGWLGSTQTIIFDANGLHAQDGTVVASMDNIRRVDRGAFAFKPSNGFVLHLKQPMPRNWVPGMWWSVGRRVGIGGVLSAADTKFVADALSVELDRR